jgi:ABC-type dipeptide/oligopeptide/nickel transport system permease component
LPTFSPGRSAALGFVIGATLGLLAAHIRGLAEQAVLMLVDAQAAMPFIILALSVLAFFGNSLALLISLLALYGWERHARVARGLALAANAQSYMLAVRQIGAGVWRRYVGHMLPNIVATLIVSATLAFPEVISRGERLVVPRSGRAAAHDLARKHGWLRTKLYFQRALDHALAERGDRAYDTLHQPHR